MVYLIKNIFPNFFSTVKCQGHTKLNGTYSWIPKSFSNKIKYSNTNYWTQVYLLFVCLFVYKGTKRFLGVLVNMCHRVTLKSLLKVYTSRNYEMCLLNFDPQNVGIMDSPQILPS